MKLENTTRWADDVCGYDIELVSQDKTTITGFGGGTRSRIALVAVAPEGEGSGLLS